MAKAGFYHDELQDIGEIDCLKDAAKEFADEHHKIDEESDTSFQVYIESDDSVLHCLNMKTDWEPIYFVDSAETINS